MRDAPIFPSAPQTQAQLSGPRDSITQFVDCLLYTSDAADE